jgi:hypothetical protein
MFFDNYSGSNIYVYRITDSNEISQIKKSIVANSSNLEKTNGITYPSKDMMINKSFLSMIILI